MTTSAPCSAKCDSPALEGEVGGGGKRQRMLAHARSMRREQTPAERTLWRALRGWQLEGLKFRHQVVLGRFIADLYCASIRLAIEVDGASHSDSAADTARNIELAQAGIHVLRFWNNEVLANLPVVLERIADTSRGRPPQATPAP